MAIESEKTNVYVGILIVIFLLLLFVMLVMIQDENTTADGTHFRFDEHGNREYYKDK